MKSDKNKTKDELIRELTTLKKQFEASASSFEKECRERGRTEKELRLAQVIIDNSPVVLFRRVAGDKPRLVYVSDNIRQMGYTAEEFLEETIHFKDVVHPDDFERVGEEIKHYMEEDVEEYTQFYRIVTKDGRIRWVEDQTSVVRDDQGNKIFNQGLLVDITRRKLAEEQSAQKRRKISPHRGDCRRGIYPHG